MKLCAKTCLLYVFICSPLFAGEPERSLGIGLFNESDGDRSGAEISVTTFGDYAGARLSGVLYGSGNNKNFDREVFMGFSATGFLYIKSALNPYLGVGVFGGEADNCTNDEEKQDKCSESMGFAVYPEAGFSINIIRFKITPYVRRYFDTSISGESGNVYGINIGANF